MATGLFRMQHGPSGPAIGQLDVREHQYALWIGLNPLKVCWGRSRTATPSLHERRQPGALSWVQSGVLWAPVWHQTGGAWPQGTPRAGGLRRGPGGAALCLTSADIDPRAPISSPMGGARGLLRNPKVRWIRLAPGGSMD